MNSFDNRIPSEPVDGIHGSGELRYGGADTTRSRSGALEAGDGNFALHDAASREFNDVRIPGYAHSSRQRQIDGDTGKHRVQNSDGRQDGGAVGGSYHWEHGYAGLSYSGYDSNYGSPAEDDVRLKMQQDRYAFASEIRDLEGPFTSLKLDAAYTKYEHKEIEDGETGTTFKNEGYEGRIEARHRPLGPLNGVVGAQFANSRFSALGEAFVPTRKPTAPRCSPWRNGSSATASTSASAPAWSTPAWTPTPRATSASPRTTVHRASPPAACPPARCAS